LSFFFSYQFFKLVSDWWLLLDALQELGDNIAPAQLIIEEVNDQAARLADSGVPLSHSNLSKLDDLNARYDASSLIVIDE